MKALTMFVAMSLALLLAAPAWAAQKITGVVNLNSASVSELDALPGVGEKAAERIIEHRKKTPFKRIEELVKVKGFGKKKFDKLKAHLTVSGPTTLEVEKTASGRKARSKH